MTKPEAEKVISEAAKETGVVIKDMLDQAREEGYQQGCKEQVEADCRAECIYCHRGDSVYVSDKCPTAGMWVHDNFDHICEANAIRKAWERRGEP
ncbi:MAG: hypothetical protein WC655_16685 [Candidatus Hydrogenedentales bacterium]|jgi:hypothetical protein